MKSRLEIIDALSRCLRSDSACSECKYHPEGMDCRACLYRDIIDLLNTSDFETMNNILGCSKEVRADFYTAISGRKIISIPVNKEYTDVIIRFDEEGNIL